MNWETLSKISSIKAVTANGAVLVGIPIFAGLLETLEHNPSVGSLIHAFDPEGIDLPFGMVRIYLASAAAFAAQLIVQFGNILGYGVLIEEASWSKTAEGKEARRKAESDTRGGNSDLDKKVSEAYEKFKREKNSKLSAVRWLASLLMLISAYLLLATFVRNAIITLQAVNDWGALLAFWRV